MTDLPTLSYTSICKIPEIKTEKNGTPFKWSLPVQALIGSPTQFMQLRKKHSDYMATKPARQPEPSRIM